MYNTTELVLKWEEKTPISFDPDMRLTEYNMQHYWYNETVVISNEVHFRHGAFSTYSDISPKVCCILSFSHFV